MSGYLPKKGELDRVIVPAAELARVLCVHERTVRRFVQDADMPKTAARNRYPLVKSVQWYVQYLISKGSGGDDASILEERRLLVRAQRLRHELEIQKRRSELIDRDEVANLLNEMAVIFSTHLETLGSRTANTLASETDPAAIQKLLTDEARAIRSSTSAAVAEFAVAHSGLGDPDSAAESKRGRVGRRKPSVAAGSA